MIGKYLYLFFSPVASTEVYIATWKLTDRPIELFNNQLFNRYLHILGTWRNIKIRQVPLESPWKMLLYSYNCGLKFITFFLAQFSHRIWHGQSSINFIQEFKSKTGTIGKPVKNAIIWLQFWFKFHNFFLGQFSHRICRD